MIERTDDSRVSVAAALAARVRATPTEAERSGVVTAVIGTGLRAKLPDVRVGELVEVEREGGPLLAQVVGYDGVEIMLSPLGPLNGVIVRARVTAMASSLTVPAGDALRGRVVNALCEPIDGAGPIRSVEHQPLLSAPPNPMMRDRISETVSTGVRVVDGLLTVGKGQRMGIFAGAGVGKSTLLAMIARNVKADVVVLALIGERGREVRGFIEDNLGEEGRARSTTVVSTSDEPALMRIRAAYAATAIAEHARAQGKSVLLMMDSVTRFARAVRDVALAAGEPAGLGWPPLVYVMLPQLFERAGTADHGTGGAITAFYTVLSESEDLKDDPVVEEVKSLLDGHVFLDPRVANRNQYPAVNVLKSKSRLMTEMLREKDKAHLDAAAWVNEVLACHKANQMRLGDTSFRPTGRDAALLKAHDEVIEFCKQQEHERATLEESVERLKKLHKRLKPQ